MKRYILKKDMPFVKAGETFGLHRGGIKDCITLFKGDEAVYTIQVGENVSEIFDEWFEEVKEPELPKEFFCIDINKVIGYDYSYFSMNKNTIQEYIRFIEQYKSVGNYFETKEEAEKYLAYLQAREVIKQDTKGFKPNWKNCENKYYGYWNSGKDSLGYLVSYITKYSDICFKTEEDIKESFKKHPEEWKTYLTYE